MPKVINVGMLCFCVKLIVASFFGDQGYLISF